MDGASPVTSDDAARFKTSLPGVLQAWSASILAAAAKQRVSPWLLAGIIYRESAGGAELTPPNATGTGDFHPRPAGRKYANGYTVGPSGMPEDGKGWGRGLAQIDYAVHYFWAIANPWEDAFTSLSYAGELLRGFYDFFAGPKGASAVLVDPWRAGGLHDANGIQLVAGWATKYGLLHLGPYADPRPLADPQLTYAALAAYNAGQSGVLQAISAQLPPDAPTSGNDYASWVLSRVNVWESRYNA